MAASMLPKAEQDVINGLCDKYGGHLSIEQIAAGIAACLENAAALYDDGLLLLREQRFARAMSLFVSGMEELGKISVLCSMARIPKTNQKLWSESWRDFRSHEKKATRAFVDTYPDEARACPDVMLVAAVEQYLLSPLSERLRQAGLYVDFHAVNKGWLSPRDVTEHDAEQWRARVELSLYRTQQLAGFGFYSAKALLIQREVYGEINTDRPRRSAMTWDDVDQIASKADDAHREFVRRLLDARILPPDSGIEMMGVPLSDFVLDK